MDDKDLHEKLDKMSPEERDKYLDALYGSVRLQGAVTAPQFDPSKNGMMGMAGFMNMQRQATPAKQSRWLDGTKWQCACGHENESKFCTECGQPAPPKPWKCVKCGTEGNTGKFCPECGAEKVNNE